jgi:hypothetical protein
VVPDKKSKTCTAAYKSFQVRVTTKEYEVNRFRWNDGRGYYDNKTVQGVLAARGTTYEPCVPYSNETNGVDNHLIQTITEKALSMTIGFQVPLVFLGETANSTVYLLQRTPNEGLKKRDDCNGSQEPYSTPYEILQAFGKPYQCQ